MDPPFEPMILRLPADVPSASLTSTFVVLVTLAKEFETKSCSSQLKQWIQVGELLWMRC